MRIVVTGATGNVGTSVVRALAADEQVDSIVGIARRRPVWRAPKTEWKRADVATSDLVPLFRGADAVVHLAWLIQPSHREDVMRRTNVLGSMRVFDAAAAAGVRALVYASSVGAYSTGPKDRRVDESWPTFGIATSTYSRHKAEVEELLDRVEIETPDLRVVRLRPGLIFKREAGSEIRRLFLGPFFPNFILRPGLIPIVPSMPSLKFQAVHSYDVGEAYRLAVVRSVRGAFNIAAEPVLDGAKIAEVLSARTVRVPEASLRAMASATWHLRLQPSDAGWLDMATHVPLMSTERARTELGWTPAHSSTDAVADLLRGIYDADGFPTPPLAPGNDGPLRIWEITTGAGSREAA
jgi:nucleoside-diphosphate-sugar epimerase